MRTLWLAALVLVLFPAAARAQGTEVGGVVPSELSLAIDDVGAFPAFDADRDTYLLTIRARVTSTDDGAELSIADGDVAVGPRLGKLSLGGAPLARPLEARRVGARAFLPLSDAVDPLLEVFDGPVANARADVLVRQRFDEGAEPAAGAADAKELLLTLSSPTP